MPRKSRRFARYVVPSLSAAVLAGTLSCPAPAQAQQLTAAQLYRLLQRAQLTGALTTSGTVATSDRSSPTPSRTLDHASDAASRTSDRASRTVSRTSGRTAGTTSSTPRVAAPTSSADLAGTIDHIDPALLRGISVDEALRTSDNARELTSSTDPAQAGNELEGLVTDLVAAGNGTQAVALMEGIAQDGLLAPFEDSYVPILTTLGSADLLTGTGGLLTTLAVDDLIAELVALLQQLLDTGSLGDLLTLVTDLLDTLLNSGVIADLLGTVQGLIGMLLDSGLLTQALGLVQTLLDAGAIDQVLGLLTGSSGREARPGDRDPHRAAGGRRGRPGARPPHRAARLRRTGRPHHRAPGPARPLLDDGLLSDATDLLSGLLANGGLDQVLGLLTGLLQGGNLADLTTLLDGLVGSLLDDGHLSPTPPTCSRAARCRRLDQVLGAASSPASCRTGPPPPPPRLLNQVTGLLTGLLPRGTGAQKKRWVKKKPSAADCVKKNIVTGLCCVPRRRQHLDTGQEQPDGDVASAAAAAVVCCLSPAHPTTRRPPAGPF